MSVNHSGEEPTEERSALDRGVFSVDSSEFESHPARGTMMRQSTMMTQMG